MPISCPPGSGGPSCSITRRTIPLYRHHNPFAHLELRPKQITGWSLAHYYVYSKMVELSHATVVVEVGSWRGLSACLLAHALKQQQRGGVLFCADTWLGSIEFWNLTSTNGMPDLTRDMSLVNGAPTVYHTFMSNMVHAHVSAYIVPMPMTSSMAARLLDGVGVDLIHLDAAHEYDDVKQDLRLWLPRLNRCGVLLGDDYMEYWPGVVRAVDEFVQEHPELDVARPALSLSVAAQVPLGTKWYARRRGCGSLPWRRTRERLLNASTTRGTNTPLMPHHVCHHKS